MGVGSEGDRDARVPEAREELSVRRIAEVLLCLPVDLDRLPPVGKRPHEFRKIRVRNVFETAFVEDALPAQGLPRGPRMGDDIHEVHALYRSHHRAMVVLDVLGDGRGVRVYAVHRGEHEVEAEAFHILLRYGHRSVLSLDVHLCAEKKRDVGRHRSELLRERVHALDRMFGAPVQMLHDPHDGEGEFLASPDDPRDTHLLPRLLEAIACGVDVNVRSGPRFHFAPP